MSEGRTLYIAILSQNQKYLRIEIYTHTYGLWRDVRDLFGGSAGGRTQDLAHAVQILYF